MAKNNNLTDFLTDVANAIREKKGTSDPINPQNFSDEIASIETGGGGGGISGTDVIFRDFDGTILHSYSANDFLSLLELPELPMQQGLICQGWNYTLEDAQNYVREYNKIEIGATYITDDGKTRLYMSIPKSRQTIFICYSQTLGNGVTIDWGDGSFSPAEPSSGKKSATHTYGQSGDYVISLSVADGCVLGFGRSDAIYSIMGMVTGSVYYANAATLRKVELGKNVIIGDYSFHKCPSLSLITIPQGVSSIGQKAFYECYALLSMVFPKGMTSIGDSALYDCYSLTAMSIPKEVTSIGNSAFYENFSLLSAIIPDNVNAFKTYVFYNCYSLSSVLLPNEMTSIGDFCFYGCWSLKSIKLPNGIKTIGTNAFYNCKSLGAIKFPDGTTTIGANFFQNCTALKNVKFPDTISALSNYVCRYCYSLSSVELPKNITTINNYSFEGCKSLAFIRIPEGVTSIGTDAFKNCIGLGCMDCRLLTSVPTLVATASLSSVPSDCKIVVPDALYEAWCAASNWSTYASRIVKASEYTE